MKMTFIEKVNHKTAFNRNKYCTCGEHGYTIVEQLKPYTDTPWSIRCVYCGRETYQTASKKTAMALWRSVKEC